MTTEKKHRTEAPRSTDARPGAEPRISDGAGSPDAPAGNHPGNGDASASAATGNASGAMSGASPGAAAAPVTGAPAATRKAGVLIVDDHPIVRHGLAQFINREQDLQVVGQANDAHEALEAIDKLKPDVVMVDLALKDRPGIELIKDIEARHPKLPVLVLSMHDESLWAERAIRAGARGYIMKEEATDRVLAALRRVLRGEIWVSDDVGARLLQKLSKGGAPAQSSPLAGLTDRELVIFRMLGLGLSVREIAEKLNLSTKTVDTHRDRIKEKLNFKSSLELLRYAIVVTLDES
jgi:DNA-binding NarL/FixJ family response regulator